MWIWLFSAALAATSVGADWNQLSATAIAPEQRGRALARLGTVPLAADGQADPLTGRAVDLILRPEQPGGPAIEARIAALELLRRRPDPAAAPALFSTFVAARTGALPEDPDLFERALRAAMHLDPVAQEAGLMAGLAPALVHHCHGQLLRRWLDPQIPPDQTLARKQAQGWLALRPGDRVVWDAEVRDALGEGWAAHGPHLVAAMQTHQGSVLDPLVQATETRILDSMVHHGRPALAQLAQELLQARGGPAPRIPVPVLPAQAPGLSPGLEPLAQPRAGSPHVRAGMGPHAARIPPALGGLAGVLALAGLGVGGAVRSHRFRGPWLALLSICLLVAVELGLRAGGAATLSDEQPLFRLADYRLELFSPVEIDGEPWLRTAGGATRAQTIRAQPQGYRVAVLGASSAHGSHWLAEESLAGQLAQRLQAAHPRQAPEVLNLGIGGTISDGVRAAGEQALAIGADCLVVFYGHNEVAQFTQVGGVPGAGAGTLRLRRWLWSSPSYSWLFDRLGAGSAARAGPAFSLSGGPSRDQIASAKQAAVANLEWNIGRLMERAAQAGARVVLVVPPTNYRFAYLHPHDSPGPGDAAHQAAAIAQAEAAAANQAPALAHERWQAVIDQSASPREATAPVKAALWRLADTHDAALLDADRLFLAHSPDGVAVSGWFWDDLHPSAQGHGVIADALTPLVAAGLPPA